MPEKKNLGHSAYMVWRIMTDRAILKVAPNLGKKSNVQTIFSVVMLVLTAVGMVGAGIWVQGYVVHPPKDYTGLCPAPAIIEKTGCFQVVPTVITRSGTVTTTTIQEPAGIILYGNTTARP